MLPFNLKSCLYKKKLVEVEIIYVNACGMNIQMLKIICGEGTLMLGGVLEGGNWL